MLSVLLAVEMCASPGKPAHAMGCALVVILVGTSVCHCGVD